ncbi:MAG: MBL fold metallo-hydrolase, partial [Janthinobacterium lividum]
MPLPADGLAGLLARPGTNGVEMAWLGQAGFLVRAVGQVVLVDPYLSDHLAQKYQGTPFSHARMMRAPIDAGDLPRVDLVICTHRHGDHMDPGTLPVLARAHPGCRFVVPAAELAFAESVGLPFDRLLPAEAGLRLKPLPGLDLTLDPLPAAHERLEQDREGRHHFMGYVISVHGLRFYHSGDCVPYTGLAEAVRALAPELALLPVNGRDAARAGNGVPGNFTLDEAMGLCDAAGIPALIPHHFNMFAFNTVDP